MKRKNEVKNKKNDSNIVTHLLCLTIILLLFSIMIQLNMYEPTIETHEESKIFHMRFYHGSIRYLPNMNTIVREDCVNTIMYTSSIYENRLGLIKIYTDEPGYCYIRYTTTKECWFGILCKDIKH